MHPVTTILVWSLLLVVVAFGLIGVLTNAVPASGLIIAALAVATVYRHGRTGPTLLLGGLTGRLPIAAWMAAHEVVRDASRDALLVAVGLVVVSLAQVPFLPAPAQLNATAHALVPLVVAIGFRVCVLAPLARQLLAGHERWIGALKEALTPPSCLTAPVDVVSNRAKVPTRRNRVA